MIIIVSSGHHLTLTKGKVGSSIELKGGQLIISSGGTAVGTTILTGLELVSRGGKSSQSQISGGSQIVYSGGIASGATVSVHGTEVLSSGGTSIATTIKNGGTEIVDAHGIASGTVVSNGGVLVDHAGAVVSGLKVLRGGTIDLAGGAFNGTIAGGGIEVVTAGTTISGQTISAGVALVVSSGASAKSTTLGTGATETVEFGGTVAGTTKMGARSTLDVIVATNSTALTVSGFGGNTIELAGFTISQPSFQYTPAVGGAAGGVLTITAESRTASIHLFGQYVAAGFHVTGVSQNIFVTYSKPSGEVPADIVAGHHLTGH
jgi:fibronectin-binding autotransporter adhesin